jgi:hypothetical protein
LSFLGGYDQTNAAQADLETNPGKYCAKNRELYAGKQQFVAEAKHVQTNTGKPVP